MAVSGFREGIRRRVEVHAAEARAAPARQGRARQAVARLRCASPSAGMFGSGRSRTRVLPDEPGPRSEFLHTITDVLGQQGTSMALPARTRRP